MKRFLILCISAIVFVGCQNDATENNEETSSATGESSTNETQVVKTTVSPTVESPAKSHQHGANDEKGPQQICLKFLEALRNDDKIGAGQNLTKQALFETRRAELELEAPGSEQASYVFGKTFYATPKKLVAQVECFVEEPDLPGKTKLIWVVKRGDSGWKISGMMMQTPDQVPDLISFENRVDVTRIKTALDESSTPTERQASLPDDQNELN